MPLTLTSPGFLSSLQDDLYFIAISSDYSGSTDLKYVFDVWVDGVQKIRSKVYPDPTTKRGYFDAGPIVRNEILYDWFNPYNDGTAVGGQDAVSLLSAPGYNGEIGIQYDIRLGYELSGSTFINQVSGTNYAGNWAAPLYKRKQSPTNIWDNKLRKYLTNRPKNISYNFESKLLIPFYNWNDTYTSNYTLKIRTNGSTGAYTSGFGFYSIDNMPWLQLDIGALALAKTINDDNDSEYWQQFNSIEVGFFAGTTLRDSVFLKQVCSPKYEPINLYFMNVYGMYDTACFGLVSKLSLETERKSFNRLNKTFGNTSVNYYVDSNDGMVYNESKINFASKTNWTYKLTMDYPTDGEYQWLSELILSPQIYAELDGDYYPVTIKNTNFEYNQNIVNGLKTLDLEIELNQTRYAFTR